jgi:hypothetical protein
MYLSLRSFNLNGRIIFAKRHQSSLRIALKNESDYLIAKFVEEYTESSAIFLS